MKYGLFGVSNIYLKDNNIILMFLFINCFECSFMALDKECLMN